MKNILKYSVRSALVLAAFALVATGLLALTKDLTEDQIIEQEKAATLRNLNAILPQPCQVSAPQCLDKPDPATCHCYDNSILEDAFDMQPDPLLGTHEVYPAWRARLGGKVVGVAFTSIAPDGYNGNIRLLVAVGADGKLMGVRVINHKETPGLGDNIEVSRGKWILSFDGKSLDNPPVDQWKVKKDGGVFDQFTGATITPRAVVKAVKKSLEYFTEHRAQLLEQENE